MGDVLHMAQTTQNGVPRLGCTLVTHTHLTQFRQGIVFVVDVGVWSEEFDVGAVVALLALLDEGAVVPEHPLDERVLLIQPEGR